MADDEDKPTADEDVDWLDTRIAVDIYDSLSETLACTNTFEDMSGPEAVDWVLGHIDYHINTPWRR